MELVLKTSGQQCLVGSNPTPSAQERQGVSANQPQGPLARHGQVNSPGAFGQLLKMLGIAVAVLLVSAVSVAAVVIYDMTNNFVQGGVEIDGQKDLPPDIAAYEGGFNILVVGLDSCEQKYAHLFGERCEGRYANAGALNDVTILIHVSDEPRRVTAISFPRDLLVRIPSCTDTRTGRTNGAMSNYPLNASYNHGGLNCVARTVTALSGQDVHFAASVTFGGVIEITNAIGGVDVCLENGIRDLHTDLNMAAGTHTVSGLQALQFLRTRYGVGDGSDLGRISNQQQYMSNLAKKVTSEDVLSDAPTLLGLARTVLNNVTPSQSLTNPVLLGQIAMVMKNVKLEDIVFLQYPSLGAPDHPGKVAPNYVVATQMWAAIEANKPLAVTYQSRGRDGVINMGPVDENGLPVDEETVLLHSSIRGTSAAMQTCSNGNVRG